MTLNDIDRIESEAENSIQNTVSNLTRHASQEDFEEILLQRRWVSYQFTPIYDLGNDLLSSDAESSKIVLRRIIREEYPDDRGGGRTPSHREDLITDLKGAGIDDSKIRSSQPSDSTLEIISDTYALIRNYGKDSLKDIRITAFLRFWGEVITAVEYEALWPRIKMLLGKCESVFYKYHMAHDKRTCPISRVALDMHASSHADALGRALVKMLPVDEIERQVAFESVRSAALDAQKNKEKFYAQFLTQKSA